MGIALALLGFGAIGVTADMAVAAGAVFLLNLFWLRPFVRVKLRTTVRWMIIMMRESAAYWAFGVFGMVYMWIDTLMLSLMTRPEVVGWYGAPTKIFQTLMFLPVLVSTAYLPRLVGAFQKGRSQLLQAAQTPLQLVLVVSLPICAVTAIAAHPFFNFLLGPAYAHAVPVMVILALCIPPIYLNIMLAQVLLAEKRQITWTVVMAGAAVLNPLINLVLIPAAEHRYANGAIGAAVSLLLTELLMTAVGLILVGRGAFDRKGLRRCLLVLAASVAMVCVARATVSLGTPASLAAGCATFLVLSVAFRVATPDEIAALRAGLPRFRSRQAT
jgi:O-antigen/teichoic acid export membrane protein